MAERPTPPPPRTKLSSAALDFAPGLLAIQESPPARLPRFVVYVTSALVIILIVWAAVGRLDIVATAEGRLIPQSYVKIVQPSDAGIVKEILISEGQHVEADQVLIRMDAHDAQADALNLQTQMEMRSLQMRRIDWELGGAAMRRQPNDPDDLFRRVMSQYDDHRLAYQDALAQAQSAARKAEQEYQSAQETLTKLRQITPILKTQADAYQAMGKDGYVPALAVDEKQRDYLEKEQELKSEVFDVEAAKSAQSAANEQAHQIASKYRSDLQNERVEADSDYRKIEQELSKQIHKRDLTELRASQTGIVKDLATHTVGTVVQPGTVILSIVPENEPLVAEVSVQNDDVGFMYPNQRARLKLAPYPFQKYGLIDGTVTHLEADAADPAASAKNSSENTQADDQRSKLTYRALISLATQEIDVQGQRYKLVPGMRVTAEINQGSRTVLEYLLSPVQRTLHNSGHER